MAKILPFSPSDYDEVMALWQATDGLTLREADSREAVTSYLARNPGLSFVAEMTGGWLGLFWQAPTAGGAISSTSQYPRLTAAKALEAASRSRCWRDSDQLGSPSVTSSFAASRRTRGSSGGRPDGRLGMT